MPTIGLGLAAFLLVSGLFHRSLRQALLMPVQAANSVLLRTLSSLDGALRAVCRLLGGYFDDRPTVQDRVSFVAEAIVTLAILAILVATDSIFVPLAIAGMTGLDLGFEPPRLAVMLAGSCLVGGGLFWGVVLSDAVGVSKLTSFARLTGARRWVTAVIALFGLGTAGFLTAELGVWRNEQAVAITSTAEGTLAAASLAAPEAATPAYAAASRTEPIGAASAGEYLTSPSAAQAQRLVTIGLAVFAVLTTAGAGHGLFHLLALLFLTAAASALIPLGALRVATRVVQRVVEWIFFVEVAAVDFVLRVARCVAAPIAHLLKLAHTEVDQEPVALLTDAPGFISAGVSKDDATGDLNRQESGRVGVEEEGIGVDAAPGTASSGGSSDTEWDPFGTRASTMGVRDE